MKGNYAGKKSIRTLSDVSSNVLYHKVNASTAAKLVHPSLQENQKKLLNKHSGRFVLVDQTQFTELRLFEKVLREDAARIQNTFSNRETGEMNQAAWLLNNIQFDIHVPTPATRLAMQDLCEKMMREYAQQATQLNTKWLLFYKQNHYDKPHLYKNYDLVYKAAHTGPLEQRSRKRKAMKTAVAKHRLRMDRDCMLYEDDLSYLAGKYAGCRERKVDYDRYFVLASKYGEFLPQEFLADPYPGFRYWKKCTIGAVKLQKLWDKYWAFQKIRRYLGAKEMQKIWRRYWALKVWRPVIKMRMKMGKRTYYRFMWNLWLEYNSICKTIKGAINFYRSNCVGLCFQALKRNRIMEQEAKAEILRKFRNRFLYRFVELCFTAWTNYAAQAIRIKRNARRLMQNPHFDTWHKYALNEKRKRIRLEATMKIQAYIHMKKAWQKYQILKKSVHRILSYIQKFKSFIFVNKIRKTVFEKEFMVWKPLELLRLDREKEEGERIRKNQRRMRCKQRLERAVLQCKKHLKSSDGKFQIQQQVSLSNIRYGPNEEYKTYKDVLSGIENEIISTCTEANRELLHHDFDIKAKGCLCCADPKCRKDFVNMELYHLHVAEDEIHTKNPKQSKMIFPQFNELHTIMSNHVGLKGIIAFISYKQGLGMITNCVDLWKEIQEFKKIEHKSPSYNQKLMSLYAMFLDEDALRPIDFDRIMVDATEDEFAEIKRMQFKLRKIQFLSFDGFYHHKRANKTSARSFLGLKGRKYVAWTDDSYFLPSNFYQAEWQTFQCIYWYLKENWTEYTSSGWWEEYQQHLAAEEKRLDENLRSVYQEFRNKKFLELAVDYRIEEKNMSQLADEVVKSNIRNEVDTLLDELIEIAKEERVEELRYMEQCAYESENMKIDDVLEWLEINMYEEFWWFFVPHMLTKMSEVPEFIKGMMEYAGMIKFAIRANRKVDINKGKETQAWWDSFWANALIEEEKIRPMKPDKAATIIQKMLRGRYLGPLYARRQCMNVWVKKWDPQYQAVYYFNMLTGDSSYQRPFITYKLFGENLHW